MPDKSRAVVFGRYGGPEVLEIVDVDLPHPAEGEIRVRVAAAGVQPFDCLFRSGRASTWMPAHFPQRLGSEFAGTIDAIGAGVEGLGVGDDVLGWSIPNAYADHVIVKPEQIAAKPPSMPWEEAAVISASGQTAATALRLLEVGEGETVVIHAAAGGVGHVAVQLARAAGANVIGTASERNHEFLRTLGATPVAYGPDLTERLQAIAPDGADAALDAAGTEEALTSSLAIVHDATRVGAVAFNPAGERFGIRHISTERSREQLERLTRHYHEGELRVAIQAAFPLADAASAHRLVEQGHGRGKVVLTTGQT
jgi:enoyl reductase